MATAISAFTRHILPDVPGCPSFVIEEKVVEAIRKFCIDTHCIKKSFETVLVFDSQFPYSLPILLDGTYYTEVDDDDNDSFEVDLTQYVTSLEPVICTDLKISGCSYDLQFKEIINDVSDYSNYRVDGVKFFNFPDNETLKMFPFESQLDDLYLLIEVVYKPVSTITTIDDVFYNDHREAICAYAKSVIQRIPKKPWTDLDHAKINAKTYTSKMGDEKINVMHGRVQGVTFVRPPFFA